MRPLRTDFAVAPRIQESTVVACGKGGLGSGPGPKRGNARKWQYPSYARTAKAKAEHRKGEKAARRHQRLLNLGFHECLICQEIILRKTDAGAEVQCRRPCSAYFHKVCADKWLKSVSGCPQCKIVPMFEGGPEEAPQAAAFRNETMRIWEGDGRSADDSDDDNDDSDDEDERHWVYDNQQRSWMTIIHTPGGQDETLYIKDFLVEYTTDRVLTPSYFDNKSFVRIFDTVYYDFAVNALPIWKANWSAGFVKGYYFLHNATDDQPGAGFFDGRIPDTWQLPELQTNMNEIPLCDTIMDEANGAEKVANVCQQLRGLQTCVVSLSYNTHNYRGTEWETEYGGAFFRAIVKNMEDKGLVRGTGEWTVYFTATIDFVWPDGVDFVATINSTSSIDIKPSCLADYIESGGALW